VHVVWREVVNGSKQDIFYIRFDGTSWSSPVNVSVSPSFTSDSPQLVADSAGTAHIVWQEEDNDHADDYETLYSKCTAVSCAPPAILSDGQVCSSFVGEWKAMYPSIGIDTNDNLMVVWTSFEPNPRNYTMYSLWPASGSPPSNRTGCHVSSGLYYYPMVAGDSNGNFHLVMMNSSSNVFYSTYTGGNWSANQSIGTGYVPVIHVDQNNKIHAAWSSSGAPPKYRSKESASTTWSVTENIFSSTTCTDLSLITDDENLPRLVCVNGSIYEASRQASGWTEATIIAGDAGITGQPNIARDVNGNLHLVWSELRNGNSEIYYSSTKLAYNCSGTPDTFEPDDTSSTGSMLILGEVQRHTLCPQSDQDWVNFQAPNTLPSKRNFLVETFDLEPDDIDPNGNTKLTVEDASGNKIGTSLIRGLGPFPGSQDVLDSSRIVWHPATGGVFNVNILPETPVNEQAGSGYSLRLANSLTMVDPVDQGSWSPTTVNVPFVTRAGNTIYFAQFFTFEQAELDALINLNTTFAWEFRRPTVDTDTGIEEDGNVDFGDYWRFMNGVCDGLSWTNLPTNPTDEYSEESNSIPGCEEKDEIGNLDDEEFEIFIKDPSALIAGKVYYVIVKFYIHNSYLNNDYQFYISKAEHCKKQPWPIPDSWCNVIQGQKSSANLIEGYLQPAP